MEIRQKPAIIGEHLKIVGNVVAEDRSVELNGQIDGEVCCAMLMVASTGRLVGKVTAKKVVVRGSVEGPIFAEELVLAADGHVKGDVVCQTVVLEKGAFLEGRITHRPAMNGASRTTELPARQQSRNHAGEGRPQVVVHSAEDRLAARR